VAVVLHSAEATANPARHLRPLPEPPPPRRHRTRSELVFRSAISTWSASALFLDTLLPLLLHRARVMFLNLFCQGGGPAVPVAALRGSAVGGAAARLARRVAAPTAAKVCG